MQSENNTTKVVVDPFCFRQFNKDGNTSNYIDCSIELMQKHVNQLYDSKLLKDGYAPFCKHLFIKNFTQAKLGILKITEENEFLIKTEYEARTEKELPVLRRFFPKLKVKEEVAEYLDIILYSKEQVQIENVAMKNIDPNQHIPYEYGIVSIKPQSIDFEIPMDPITQMRNHLGVEFGGSGVPLNAQKYKEACDNQMKKQFTKQLF